MACSYYGIEEHPLQKRAYDAAMDGFCLLYYIECVVKIIALKPCTY